MPELTVASYLVVLQRVVGSASNLISVEYAACVKEPDSFSSEFPVKIGAFPMLAYEYRFNTMG